MPFRKVLWTRTKTVIAVSLMFSFPATAQIQVDSLSPASAYDAGLLEPGQGGLASNLWQNTSAPRATALIDGLEELEAGFLKDGPARTLIRAALLSGGVPPTANDQFERDAYHVARLRAVLNLFGISAYDQLSRRSSVNPNTSGFAELLVERALLGGDIEQACTVSDRQITERGAAYWAKLRAFCHFKRDELPAAELTADLVKRNEHADPAFFLLLGNLTGSQIKPAKVKDIISPLHMAMARDVFKASTLRRTDMNRLPLPLAAAMALDEQLSPELRLSALSRALPLLDSAQLASVLNGFSETGLEDLQNIDRRGKWTPAKWGQSYISLKTSTDPALSAALISAILQQAEKISGFSKFSELLAPDIIRTPHQNQAETNPQVFTRLAVMSGDIAQLRGLHRELAPDDKFRPRIALAADALGGGFLAGDLGIDIETRLTGKGGEKTRAVRDTFLAVALGAGLSAPNVQIITGHKKSRGTVIQPGDFLVLKAAARRGSRAEIALRTAYILEAKPLSALSDNALADFVFIFNEAGMSDSAARLAAEDFIEP